MRMRSWVKSASTAASLGGDWSGRRDLNPRPSRWQRDALPLSYTRVHGGRRSYAARRGRLARRPAAAPSHSQPRGRDRRRDRLPYGRRSPRLQLAPRVNRRVPPLPATRQDLLARLAELGIDTTHASTTRRCSRSPRAPSSSASSRAGTPRTCSSRTRRAGCSWSWRWAMPISTSRPCTRGWAATA